MHVVLSGVDECNSNACTNNATCSDVHNGYTCQCQDGFTGAFCQTDINECSSLPCQNNGTCNDLVNSFSCNCAPGFTGTTCAADINECLTKQCQNGATCVDLVNAYVCQCVAGYTGTNCETDINECSPNPCQNGATCAHSINNYTCTCVAGYTGRNCQIDIDECSPSPCLNGGLCSNEINKYTCNCTSGYTGVNCRPAVLGDDCSVRPAVCSNILNSQCTGGTCQCLAGYEKTGEATCSKKDCPDLTAPINGAVQFIPSKDYLSKAEYSCSVGYTLTGISTRTCTATGAWDGSSPTCVIKDCKAITAPSSGTIDQGTGTTYGSSSYFTCNTGYTLIGALSTTCTSAGNWDNPKPVCEIKDCGTLSEPMNGDVDLSQGTKYGAKASFTCKTGHTLVGLPSPTCTSAGIWSSAAPVCQINGGKCPAYKPVRT
ncbi:fibropellin-3-like [Dreissena polymorpha]|uniref:fibropellin-3-like n=1 Tax=Dreissena polymorpha TaxID=45954 RepID=UPI00226417E5|nr:fibropellin-3-like [Dreissena polymorpha]